MKKVGMSKNTFKLFCIPLLLFSWLNLQAQLEDQPNPHQIFVGSEVYHVKRLREGGGEQKGWLYGARVGYDYIKRCKFYYGIEGLYAQGKLKGDACENKLRSDLIDANVESRIGYTFQSDTCHHATFIPFVGFGYFWEINRYKPPSPLSVHFDNNFYYFPFGFYSSIFINPNWSLGLNFKARLILDGKTKVTHDPNFDALSLRYNQKVQYRLEFPINYYFCFAAQEGGLSFVPFYEMRHYGYHPNFPFDFLETKFILLGATLKLLYLF